MKRVLFLLMAIVALASSSASAQIISGVKGSLASRNSQGGVIKITEDEGTKQAVHVVEKNTKRPEKADGYRFVIFYDNEQFADERARDALAKFRSNYKSVSSYLSSEAPSFRIVVGDCFTYEDVAILRNLIGDDYPDAALSDARIPYKVLCRIKGQNRMKIERSGVVTGGIEFDKLYYEELVDDEELSQVSAEATVETPAEATAAVETAAAEESKTEAVVEEAKAEVVAEAAAETATEAEAKATETTEK